MMVEYTTILDALEVRMRLGIHPDEAEPQRVRLSVRMTVSYPQSLGGDRIDAVLDYDFIREGIHALAAEGFALQETLCDAVAELCLRDPRVVTVQVSSTKPDVYPDAMVGCEIVRRREPVTTGHRE